jgi:hypothetical protein
MSMINTISIQKNTINVSKRIYYKNILYNKSNDIYFVSRALIFLYNFSQLRNTRIVIFFYGGSSPKAVRTEAP